MKQGQGVGLPELDPRVADHIRDAVKGYLRKTRSDEPRSQMDLYSLLERFYRYGLEDRRD